MEEAIEGLTDLLAWNTQFHSTTYQMASVLAAVLLMVSLVFVVDALANRKEHAKSYLITWLVGLVFMILFILK